MIHFYKRSWLSNSGTDHGKKVAVLELWKFSMHFKIQIKFLNISNLNYAATFEQSTAKVYQMAGAYKLTLYLWSVGNQQKKSKKRKENTL